MNVIFVIIFVIVFFLFIFLEKIFIMMVGKKFVVVKLKVKVIIEVMNLGGLILK